MSDISAGVRHSETTFTGVANLRLFAQSWDNPDIPRRAILIILHGLKDHSSRYSELASATVKRGFVVSAFDHRGHGRSQGKRAYVNRFDDYLADLRTFITMVREKDPGLPLFIFGHSMGGTMTTIAVIKRVADFQGVVLSAAALVPGKGVSSTLIRVTRVLGAIAPQLPLMNLPNERFSRDRKVVDAMSADPLIYQKNGPVRTAAQLLNAMRYIKIGMRDFTAPVLILHGDADQLTNPQGSRALLTRCESTDKALKVYPGLVHDLVHEPEKDRVISDIAGWLEVHLPPRVPEQKSA
jgi:alpha-beta hydrolase superfamily lysophospholipase